jgi:hypothetical protein
MTKARIQAILIRGAWTFLFAFFSQPIIAAAMSKNVAFTAREAYVAALAALAYAVKKAIWPNTVL